MLVTHLPCLTHCYTLHIDLYQLNALEHIPKSTAWKQFNICTITDRRYKTRSAHNAWEDKMLANAISIVQLWIQPLLSLFGTSPQRPHNCEFEAHTSKYISIFKSDASHTLKTISSDPCYERMLFGALNYGHELLE